MENKINCRTIDTLNEHDSLGKAIALITGKRLAALPVVNDRNEFVGTIGVNGLLEMLLPRAIRAVLERDGSAVPDLAFMGDNINELRDKLRDMSDTPVGKLAKRDVPVIYPDSPVMEAVLLLLRGEDDVPLVERETRKFRGMVSALDLLHMLQQGAGK